MDRTHDAGRASLHARAMCIAILVAVTGAAHAYGVYPTAKAPLRVPTIPPSTPHDPVLLKLKPGVGLDDLRATVHDGLKVDARVYSKVPGWATVLVPKGFTTDAVLGVIADADLAEIASRHGRFCACYLPDDPYAIDADPQADPGQYYLYDINAFEAWDLQRGSPDVTIAILDSGISIYHEDLAANIWRNSGEIQDNGLDDDLNGYVDDYWGWDLAGPNIGSTDEAADPDTYMPLQDEYPTVWDPDWWLGDAPYSSDPAIGDIDDNNGDGLPDGGVTHGTMVSGLANAVTDNGMDIAGVAFNTKTMTVRVMNPEGWGWDEDAAAGIIYAADNNADVINMSFSFGLREDVPEATVQMMEEAIEYAVSRGCILVSAAGNSRGQGGYAGGLDFPADMNETISVGAVDWERVVSGYSNYAEAGQTLDVVAPGDLTFTTSVMDMYTWALWTMLYPDEGWELGTDLLDVPLGGTSFSTPLVSGFAGLLRSRFPASVLGYEEFREVLHGSSLDLGAAGYDPDYGFGELDMYAAIQHADVLFAWAIPEPGSLTLLLVGLGALTYLRRRRAR